MIPYKILDVGSGQGDFMKKASAKFPGSSLVGFEASEVGVDISSKKVPEAVFYVVDVFNPGKQIKEAFSGWSNVITCSEVLEHVDDPTDFVSNLLQFLSDNGSFIVTVPGGPKSQYDEAIGHRRHFNARDLSLLLNKAGLSDVKVYRAGFPFFNLYRLIIVARGKNLIEDVKSGSRGKLKWLAFLLMQIFGFLFNFNLSNSLFGWQMVAVAKKNSRDKEVYSRLVQI